MSTIPLAEARAQLSRLVEAAVTTHAQTEITRNGVRAAVLLAADDYDALLETLDVLADQPLAREITVALAEHAQGDVVSTEEVLARMAARRANGK